MTKVFKNIKYFVFDLKIVSYKYMLLNIFITILTSLNTTINLLFFKQIIDVLATRHDINIIFDYTLIYGIYLIVSSLLNIYLTSIYNPKENVLIQRNLQRIIFDKIKILDISCFENSDFYNKYVRAMNETDNRFFQIFDTILQLVSGIVSVSSLIVLISTLDPVFIIFAVFMVVSTIFRSFKANENQYLLDKESTKNKRERAYVKRIFYLQQYTKELKLFPLFEMFTKIYDEATDRLVGIVAKYSLKKAKIDFVNVILNSITTLSLVFFLSLKILAGSISIGDFMIVFSSVTNLSKSLSGILTIIPNLSIHSMYIDNLLELLNYRPIIDEEGIGLSLQSSDFKNICFRNVSFSYDFEKENGKKVINNLSLNIESGKKIAIVGRNGSGKSTFIKLLLRLYDPHNGTIEMNGHLYKDYNIRSLRSIFSVLFQDYNLYALTIGENILMEHVNSKEQEELVWEALKFSGLYDKVKKMENGINTVITKEFDNSGVYFSGGEKQLLSIARAYAFKGTVLIFDEPSSSLDVIFERLFFNKLMELGNDKTVIYVTHNLEATLNADIIYYIEDGSIVEEGTHNELIDLNGKYRVMFDAQQNKYIA